MFILTHPLTKITETFRHYDEAVNYAMTESLSTELIQAVDVEMPIKVKTTQLDIIARQHAEKATTYAFHDQYTEAFKTGYNYAIAILSAVDR
jgi:hypothetical protein